MNSEHASTLRGQTALSNTPTQSSSVRDTDVAIVGVSCVFPKSPDADTYWANLVNSVDAVTEVPTDRWTGLKGILDNCADSHCLPQPSRGAFLPADIAFDPIRYGVLPNAVQHGDPDQFLMLSVVAKALDDAGIADKDPIRRRTDLIAGHGGYSSVKMLETLYRAQGYDEILQLIERGFPDLLSTSQREEVREYMKESLPPNAVEAMLTTMPNLIACRSANRLDLGGAAYLVDGACASSLLAVEHGVGRLRAGLADTVVAAGIFMTNYIPFWHIFACLGALSADGQIRPMDRRANGLVVGEGAGAIVLKRLSDALQSGDHIYAVVKGVGVSSNGRTGDVLSPSADGQVVAIERAYQDGQIDPESIGYLELHGTGTVAGDTVELESIRRFFGGNTGRFHRCMGSVKSMIGHAMPASGMASIIKVALALNNKTIPPSLHCGEPREQVGETDFFVNTSVRPWVHDWAAGARRAGVNAFGFGGINAHVILEEVTESCGIDDRVALPRPVRVVKQWESELFAFSAPDVDGVVDQVQSVLSWLDKHEGWELSAADLAYTLWQDFDTGDPCRLALVCEDIDTLKKELSDSVTRIQRDASDFRTVSTSFAVDAAEPIGKVAVIFPGNGFPGMVGEFPDHLRELALFFPSVRQEIDFISARDRHPDDPIPLEAILWPPAAISEETRQRFNERLHSPNQEEEVDWGPDERHLAAVALMLSNWIRWVLLQKLNVPVDMITGLSLGEMTGVCAAGCYDYYSAAHPYLQSTMDVADEMLRSSGARMMFLFVSEDRIAKIFEQYPEVVLSIEVSKQAFVIAGPPSDLEEIAVQLREERVVTQPLPFPPVHTRYFSRATELLAEAFDASQLACSAPSIPVYSSILASPYPDDPDGVRTLLYRNFSEPLKVHQTLNQMYVDGARVLIQAGIGQISMLSSGVFPEDAEIHAVGIDLEHVAPVVQLQRMCGMLLSCGMPLTLDPLFENRDLERIDLSAPLQTQPNRQIGLRMDWSPLTAASSQTPYSGAESEQPASATGVSEPPQESQPTEAAAPVTATEEAPANPPASAAADAPVPDDVLAAADQLPLVGPIVEYVADQSVVFERTFSLEEDRFLLDHLFISAQEVKPPEECWPVVPMPFSMEMFAEAGALLAPDRGLLRFESVRMSRWIDVTEQGPRTVRTTGKVTADDPEQGLRTVEVVIESDGIRVAAGSVVFGPQYLETMAPLELPEETGEPWPLSADDSYGTGRLFHGPMIQVLHRLGDYGHSAFTGELKILPKDGLFASTDAPQLFIDPCLMDGISQLCGLWLQLHGSMVFPSGVEGVEFYGPTPPPGTTVTARLALSEYNEHTRQYFFSGYLDDGAGNVWMRIDGWTDWLFPYTPRFGLWTLMPTKLIMAEELELAAPGSDLVAAYISSTAIRANGLERGWRTALNSAEGLELQSIATDDDKRVFLNAHVTIKDAVRVWWRHVYGTENTHPGHVEVHFDEQGRPFVTNPYGLPNPHVSIAQVNRATVALASTEPNAIVAARAGRGEPDALENFTHTGERQWLDHVAQEAPDGQWSLRLWCAKQVAAQFWQLPADGPWLDYSSDEMTIDGQMTIRHVESGETLCVATAIVDSLALAWLP